MSCVTKVLFYFLCGSAVCPLEPEYFPTVSRYTVGFLKKLFWWERVALEQLVGFLSSSAKEQT